MTEDVGNVMPILYNDENWYVCGHGVHNGLEVVEVVNKVSCEGAVLLGETGENFLDQLSEINSNVDPGAMSEFMSHYTGLMHKVSQQ